MEQKIMTVLYRKRDKLICGIFTGNVPYSMLAGGMDEEDAKLVYGKIQLPLDRFVIENKNFFELNDNLKLIMKDNAIEQIKKYL